MLRAVGIAIVLSLASYTAHALPVQWTLHDAVFQDGATASGYFILDGNQCTAVDISTTAGAGHRASHYLLEPYHGCAPSTGFHFFETQGGSNGIGSGILSLKFYSPAGGPQYLPEIGTVSLISPQFPQNGNSEEDTCGSGGTPCGFSSPYRLMISGYLVGAPVPIPPAAWLFGGALGLLGIARRQRNDS